MAKKNQNSKVLISFLGAGNESRRYRDAHYRLGERGEHDLGEHKFIASALNGYYHFDKMLLIGTVGSMWEEVYSEFADPSIPDKKTICDEIFDHCIGSGYDAPLELPHRADIERALGEGSRAVLIRYGLNEAELRENIGIILGLQQCLDDGDELIVDVTHSFRSLPIFLVNLLIYLQNVSPKRITISHIHYGMLEVSTTMGYTPVLDLKPMLEMNDWITGAYNFMKFGNAYKIAQLLNDDKTGDYKNTAQALLKFSDLKNMNLLRQYRRNMPELAKITSDRDLVLPPMGRMIVPEVIEAFVKQFDKRDAPDDLFRLNMARWHFERKYYVLAFVNLIEAVKSYCCCILGKDPDDPKSRFLVTTALAFNSDKEPSMFTAKERAANNLLGEIVERLKVRPQSGGFLDHYACVNRSRNKIVHEIVKGIGNDNDLDKRRYDEELQDLENALKFFGTLIQARAREAKTRPAAAVAPAALTQPEAQPTAGTDTSSVFINFSNHPSSTWGEEQLAAARALGTVVDIPFPQVDPAMPLEQVKQLASESVQLIKSHRGTTTTVHIMGEMTLLHHVVTRLKASGMRCVASTTERIATEVDGKKITEFHFVQFRDY